MKTLLRFGAITALTLIMGAVCFGQHYTQTNLVSNTSGAAPVTDPQLINPWGISRGSGSPWWISDNATGLSTLYDGAGVKQSLIVTIPPADPTNKNKPTGSPTGTIFNGSQTDFLLAAGKPAVFLFSTIDGTIAGWNPNVAVAQGAAPPSTHAVTVVKTTDGSSYTGLTSAFIDGKRFLYAANFTNGRVDVYDNAFQPVKLSKDRSDDEDSSDHKQSDEGSSDHKQSDEGSSDHKKSDEDSSNHNGQFSENAFFDESLPRPYVPFNVQAIGNDIVVTYAVHQEGSPFETDGPGLGFVDIYSSTGRLLRRLEHGDWLNAPWGVALAPLDFGRFSHDLLVGQFAGGGETQSSGFIAAYDLATGKFDGLLQDASGKPLVINGIWSLSPGNVGPANYDPAAAPAGEVYFTAGPNHGSGGLFGYLTVVSTELIEGNAQ
jgi:hypothetical protein